MTRRSQFPSLHVSDDPMVVQIYVRGNYAVPHSAQHVEGNWWECTFTYFSEFAQFLMEIGTYGVVQVDEHVCVYVGDDDF